MVELLQLEVDPTVGLLAKLMHNVTCIPLLVRSIHRFTRIPCLDRLIQQQLTATPLHLQQFRDKDSPALPLTGKDSLALPLTGIIYFV